MTNIYLDITDDNGNIIGRFYDGHFMTLLFDSGRGYVDETINVVSPLTLSTGVLNAAAEKMKCTFVANTPSNVPANAKYVIVEDASNLKSVRIRCANAKIYLVISDISDANTPIEYPTIDIYKTGYLNPTDAQKAEKLIKELYYK